MLNIHILIDDFNIYLLTHRSTHKTEPYFNKLIKDYDLLKVIYGNNQAKGHHAIQFENIIGIQCTSTQSQKHLTLLNILMICFFGETDGHGYSTR